MQDQCVRFTVQAGSRDVWLASQASRPLDVGAGLDFRALGVCLAKMSIEDGSTLPHEISLEHTALGVGYHELERSGEVTWRWTTGRAQLPEALWAHRSGDFTLRVDLAGPALPRWVAPADEPSYESSQAA